MGLNMSDTTLYCSDPLGLTDVRTKGCNRGGGRTTIRTLKHHTAPLPYIHVKSFFCSSPIADPVAKTPKGTVVIFSNYASSFVRRGSRRRPALDRMLMTWKVNPDMSRMLDDFAVCSSYLGPGTMCTVSLRITEPILTAISCSAGRRVGDHFVPRLMSAALEGVCSRTIALEPFSRKVRSFSLSESKHNPRAGYLHALRNASGGVPRRFSRRTQAC